MMYTHPFDGNTPFDGLGGGLDAFDPHDTGTYFDCLGGGFQVRAGVYLFMMYGCLCTHVVNC